MMHVNLANLIYETECNQVEPKHQSALRFFQFHLTRMKFHRSLLESVAIPAKPEILREAPDTAETYMFVCY